MAGDTTRGRWVDVAPRGTAYVTEVRVSGAGVVVTLKYPGGTHVVEIGCVPRPEDREMPDAVTRVLAASIRSRGAAFECTVLGTSLEGPVRLGITLAQALALASSGVHTTFRID